MRVLARGVLGVWAALAAAPVSAAPFLSPQDCRFTPPSGWRHLTAAGPQLGRVTVFAAPPVDRFAANISLVTTPAPPGAPSALFRVLEAQVNAVYPKQFVHYRLQSEKRMTVAWSPALQLVAMYQTGKSLRRVRVHQVYLLRDGLFYLFTLTSLPENYAHNNTAFAVLLHHLYWVG